VNTLSLITSYFSGHFLLESVTTPTTKGEVLKTLFFRREGRTGPVGGLGKGEVTGKGCRRVNMV
jgi:hypothetical protein